MNPLYTKKTIHNALFIMHNKKQEKRVFSITRQ
jgi:CMP-N-acetylneuraminic acid synthetase